MMDGDSMRLLTTVGSSWAAVCAQAFHAATFCACMQVAEMFLISLQDCQRFWETILPGVMRRRQAVVSQLRHSSAC